MGFPHADAMKFADTWLPVRHAAAAYPTIAENVTFASAVDGLSPRDASANVPRTKIDGQAVVGVRGTTRIQGQKVVGRSGSPGGKRLLVSDVTTAPGGSLTVTSRAGTSPSTCACRSTSSTPNGQDLGHGGLSRRTFAAGTALSRRARRGRASGISRSHSRYSPIAGRLPDTACWKRCRTPDRIGYRRRGRGRRSRARSRRRTPLHAPHASSTSGTAPPSAVAASSSLSAIVAGLAGVEPRRRASTSASTRPSDAPETAALLRGIPQHGTVLGSPNAPVKLVEYADLQCVYCGVWARDVFPTLVRRYVRTGKVQLEFRGLAFVGADSETALRTALAASEQNKLWNVVELLYRNQGAENSGWVNDGFVKAALAAIPGLDASRVLAARDGAAVTALADSAADRRAQRT